MQIIRCWLIRFWQIIIAVVRIFHAMAFSQEMINIFNLDRIIEITILRLLRHLLGAQLSLIAFQ